MAEIKHLSPSKIEAAMKCPEQFKLRYVDKIPEISVGTMMAGRVIHKVNELALNEVIAGKPLPSAKDLDDIFVSDWQRQFKEEEAKESFLGWKWDDDDPAEKVYRESRAMVPYLHQHVLPKVRPQFVEHTVKEEYHDEVYGSFLVWMVIDLLEAGGLLTDWKTTNDEVSQNARKSWFQMAAYSKFVSEVTGQKIVTARKVFLLRSPQPSHQVVFYKMGPTHREWFAKQAAMTWRMVQAGSYVANPSGWWCGKKWCSFHAMCQGELS